MLYYPPGRGLLIVAGLLHIAASIATIAGSISEISSILYSTIPLMGLPDTLPNIPWIGHYWLALMIAVGNFALGIIAIKHRQNSEKAKFLLIISAAGFIIYAGFVVFSGYDEAALRGNPWVTLPFGFAVPILYILGAGINFVAHLKHIKKTQK